MCLFRRQLDPKSRRIYAAGNLCLVSGLMLNMFHEHGFGDRHPGPLLALRFLLMGLAIGFFFWFARRRGGCASRP